MNQLSVSDIQQIFKNMGKIIFVAQRSALDAEGYKRAMLGLVDQGVSGNAAEWTMFIEVFTPFTAIIKNSVTGLDRLAPEAARMVSIYMQKVIGPMLGAPVDSTTAEIIEYFANNMASATSPQTVSGPVASHANGFGAYFLANFGVTLPGSAVTTTGTISDTWIDDDVIQ